MRYAEPSDPWADDPEPTLELPVPQARDRQIYGRVYELITGDPQDGPHPYVGKTIQTLHQRVHASRSAHTSAASIAKDPWKARILPGAAGYRLLENVYDTGDLAENKRALARAESDWMDRYRTTHNKIRPVRPPVHERPAPARPASRPKVTPAARARRHRAERRIVAFALLFVGAFFLVARVVTEMHLPWSQPAQFATATGVTTLLTWWAFVTLESGIRRVTRGRR